jgi:hypothetical protein
MSQVRRGACFAFTVSGEASSLRANEPVSVKKRHVFLGKFEIMAYVAYEIRQTKETATGTRHLVRCNRLGKYAICSWVGSEGNVMGNPECQGNYDYVMKNWKKIHGKFVPVT